MDLLINTFTNHYRVLSGFLYVLTGENSKVGFSEGIQGTLQVKCGCSLQLDGNTYIYIKLVYS